MVRTTPSYSNFQAESASKNITLAERAAEDRPSLTKTAGPVIRVAPNELSIYDIGACLSEIYAQNTKFTKAPYFYEAFDNPHGTVFSQLDKAAHSGEKRLMSHAFSRRNIVGMQHELYRHVHKWVERLRAHARAGRPVPLSRAAQCLTLDNVSYFSYGSDEGARLGRLPERAARPVRGVPQAHHRLPLPPVPSDPGQHPAALLVVFVVGRSSHPGEF